MLAALVYGSIFLMVLGALSGYVLTQNKIQSNETASARATAIAEAGLEYYRWFLAHYPNDIQNGTGQPGPYVIPYADPEGGDTGTIELAIQANSACGTVTSVDIESMGIPAESPAVTSTLVARYAKPTVARYSFVLNSTTWAGPDRVIQGPYHSNGGIRMDGTSNSIVTSSLASWLCTFTYNCTPSQTVPGVYGGGTDQSLWSYPVPQVDFAGIAADFNSLKTKAQADGRYLPRFSSSTRKQAASYWHGYRLIFNANGTITVRRVNSTTRVQSDQLNSVDEAQDLDDRTLISNDTFYSTITPSSSCGLIFVEDHVWIEGVVDGKFTVVAANVTNSGIAPNAMLRGSITYENTDGTDGLTVIAENNVLITPDSPYNMTLNGIFVAQAGAFGRNFYKCTSYDQRGTLTILGTTVSNLRTGTQYPDACGSGAGRWDAGYQNRSDTYHRALSNDPPPFTPEMSGDYEFIDWRQD